MSKPVFIHISLIFLVSMPGLFSINCFGNNFSDPDTLILPLFVGQHELVCIDPELSNGPVDSIFNFCSQNSVFEFEFENDSCILFTGNEIGAAYGCFFVCDSSGFCDTTIFDVMTIPYPFPPSLQNDSTTTLQESPQNFDPLGNDTLLGGVTNYFLLDLPISGQATLNLDGSITYVPENGLCARWDNFSYVVCNPIGCDTATVNVFIECVELTIFNAVSPNNDGVNDYFYIAKIENFPNNRLWVYNRWGSLVFDSGSDGYQNNWPGSWGDEIDLPDGSYFYILEWQDGSQSHSRNGYIEMFR